MIITHEYPVCEYDTARDPIIHPTDFLDKCLPKKCIITFFRKELEKEKMAPAYRDRLLELLPGMFQKWEPILGVCSNKVTIRKTKSQWGSCNTKNGNISISLWLGASKNSCSFQR